MNQIAKRNQNQLALHGKLAELFGQVYDQQADDLSGGVSVGFPVLSIKGKVFHIKQGGEAELVTAPGTDDPAPSLEVVLLKANPNISKVYYPNGYVDGADEKPTCYSNNGIQPEQDSEEIQSTSCAKCPHNQWGSRITDDGRKGKACSDSRRVAVAPAGDVSNAMLLRVPAASLKPLSEYGKALNKRGVPYQAVITKLSFDHTVAHPLLKFAPVAALKEDQADAVFETMQGDVVQSILNGGNAQQVAQELDAAGETDEAESFDQVAVEAQAVAARQAAQTQTTTSKAATPRPKATPRPAATVSAAEVAEAVGAAADALAAKPATTPKNATTTASAAANAPVVDGNVDDALGDLLKAFEGE